MLRRLILPIAAARKPWCALDYCGSILRILLRLFQVREVLLGRVRRALAAWSILVCRIVVHMRMRNLLDSCQPGQESWLPASSCARTGWQPGWSARTRIIRFAL